MPRATWAGLDFSAQQIDVEEYIPEGMFAARYTGMCSECGDRIGKGKPMGYMDDEIVCEDCFIPYSER